MIRYLLPILGVVFFFSLFLVFSLSFLLLFLSLLGKERERKIGQRD